MLNERKNGKRLLWLMALVFFFLASGWLSSQTTLCTLEGIILDE